MPAQLSSCRPPLRSALAGSPAPSLCPQGGANPRTARRPCCCRFCWRCLLLLAPPARLGCPGVERAEYLSRPGAPLPGAAAKGSFCEVRPAGGALFWLWGGAVACCCSAWVSRSGCCCLSGARGRLLCFGSCLSLRRGLGSRRPCAGSAGAGELSAAPPGRVPLRGAKRALLRSFRAPPLLVLSPFVPRAPGRAGGAGSLCVSSAFVLVSGAAAGGGCPPAGRAPGCGSPAAGGLRGVGGCVSAPAGAEPPVNTPAVPFGVCSPGGVPFGAAAAGGGSAAAAAVLSRRLGGRLSAFFRGGAPASGGLPLPARPGFSLARVINNA